jgi:hypothetical protein
VRPLSQRGGGVAAEAIVRGNLVPDAHVATILKQRGLRTLFTKDKTRDRRLARPHQARSIPLHRPRGLHPRDVTRRGGTPSHGASWLQL